MEEGENSWGEGAALWVNSRQVANFSGEDALELRLTRPVIRELRERLRANGRVTIRASSDWVNLRIGSESDVDLALELAARLPALYLPADGTIPKPPPTGAAMERRKRFH